MSIPTLEENLLTFADVLPKAEVQSITLNGNKNDKNSHLYANLQIRIFDDLQNDFISNLTDYSKYYRLLVYADTDYEGANGRSALSAEKKKELSNTKSSWDFKGSIGNIPNYSFVDIVPSNFIRTVNVDGKEVIEQTLSADLKLPPDPKNLTFYVIPYLDIASVLKETLEFDWTDAPYIKSRGLITETSIENYIVTNGKVVDNRTQKLPFDTSSVNDQLKLNFETNFSKLLPKVTKSNTNGRYFSDIYLTTNESLECVFLFAFNKTEFLLQNSNNPDYYLKNDISNAVIKNITIFRQRKDLEASTYYSPIYEKVISSLEQDQKILDANENNNSLRAVAQGRDIILFEIKDHDVKNKNFGLYGYKVEIDITDPTLIINRNNLFDATGIGSGNKVSTLLRASNRFSYLREPTMKVGAIDLINYDDKKDYFSIGYYDSNHDIKNINEAFDFSTISLNSLRDIAKDNYTSHVDELDLLAEKLLQPYFDALEIDFKRFQLKKDYKYAYLSKYTNDNQIVNFAKNPNVLKNPALNLFKPVSKSLMDYMPNVLKNTETFAKLNLFGQKTTLDKKASMNANLDMDLNKNYDFIKNNELLKTLDTFEQTMINNIEQGEKLMYLSNGDLNLSELIALANSDPTNVSLFINSLDIPYGVKLLKLISIYSSSKNNMEVFDAVNNLLKVEDNFIRYFNYFKNYKVVKYLDRVEQVYDKKNQYLGMTFVWSELTMTEKSDKLLCRLDDIKNYQNYNKEFVTSNRYFTISNTATKSDIQFKKLKIG